MLNVKALIGDFNQEKAQVGAFSVIVKTNGSFAALIKYKINIPRLSTLPTQKDTDNWD